MPQMLTRMHQTAMTTKSSISFIAGLALFSVIFLTSACGPNDRIMRSANDNEPSATPTDAVPQVDEYTREVEAMRTANLETVFSIRRKDGGKFEGDDRNIIRVNTAIANRRVVGYDDTWAVIGTNNKLSVENMKVLTERFAIKIYSTGPVENDGEVEKKTPANK